MALHYCQQFSVIFNPNKCYLYLCVMGNFKQIEVVILCCLIRDIFMLLTANTHSMVYNVIITPVDKQINLYHVYVIWYTVSEMFTIINSNMTSFFRFVDKRGSYRLGIISLAHAPVHVTDFSVVNVHVDELSSARIWQHKLCATNVNINYRLPIKEYYCICTLRHIRIEINHGSQKVF